MGAPLPWLVLAVVATLINTASLGYLAWRERSLTLRLWSWGWGAWAAAAFVLGFSDPARPSIAALLACGVCWVVSSLCLVSGTYELTGRRMPRPWYAVAAACVALALVVGLAFARLGPLTLAPLVVFQCVGLLTAGVMIISKTQGRAGALPAGIALIGLAIHILDAPLVMHYPELVPWGFLLAVALEIVTALGMVTLYYDSARVQLLEAQRSLDQKRRVEALGMVAGGVAHDFNNILAVLMGHLDLMRIGRSDAQNRESFLAMDQALQQAVRLTSQLLPFGKGDSLQMRTTIEISEVVEATVSLLRKLLPAGVQLTFQRGGGDLTVSGDRALIEQIIMNLVTNARDAITGTGTISIHLEDAGPPAAGALLRVIDSGGGMAPELLARVFEPFFTTKEPGQGTGLGLASVQRAVNELRGRVSVQSTLGVGTTFEVFLPRPQQ